MPSATMFVGTPLLSLLVLLLALCMVVATSLPIHHTAVHSGTMAVTGAKGPLGSKRAFHQAQRNSRLSLQSRGQSRFPRSLQVSNSPVYDIDSSDYRVDDVEEQPHDNDEYNFGTDLRPIHIQDSAIQGAQDIMNILFEETTKMREQRLHSFNLTEEAKYWADYFSTQKESAGGQERFDYSILLSALSLPENLTRAIVGEFGIASILREAAALEPMFANKAERAKRLHYRSVQCAQNVDKLFGRVGEYGTCDVDLGLMLAKINQMVEEFGKSSFSIFILTQIASSFQAVAEGIMPDFTYQNSEFLNDEAWTELLSAPFDLSFTVPQHGDDLGLFKSIIYMLHHVVGDVIHTSAQVAWMLLNDNSVDQQTILHREAVILKISSTIFETFKEEENYYHSGFKQAATAIISNEQLREQVRVLVPSLV